MLQQSFLWVVADQILSQPPLGPLSDKDKNLYRPQIESLLEERIGLELLPKLDKKYADEFIKLLEDEKTTLYQWKTFWSKAMPDFEDRAADIIADFIESSAKFA